MGDANCGPALYIKQDEQEDMERIHHSSMVSAAVPASGFPPQLPSGMESYLVTCKQGYAEINPFKLLLVTMFIKLK